MSMKKSLLTIAALGAFAGAAHAQSTVTLYGLIDEGLSYTNNVRTGFDAKGNPTHGSLWAIQSGVLQGSRWGMKGTEDLGGGLKTIFQIEGGFNASNGALGQGGLLFGRQAYVGLASANAGTVTLGRQYDSVVDYLGPLTANGSWGGTFFAHPFDNDNTNNSFRVNNAVKYTSANYSGFQFGGLYGFSNSPQFAQNRAWSLGARYSNGPLTVAAAYLDLKNPGSTCGGALPGTLLNSAGVNACTGSDTTFAASKQRTGGMGANYAFGPATVGVMASETLLNSWAGTMHTTRFLNVEANAQYFASSALSLGAMYDYTRVNGGFTGSGLDGNTGYHFNMIGLMSDYFLSKRTDVYAQAVYNIGSESARGGVAIVGAGGASTSTSQVVARVGIRHKF